MKKVCVEKCWRRKRGERQEREKERQRYREEREREREIYHFVYSVYFKHVYVSYERGNVYDFSLTVFQ
jgi:hypothetical protein